MPFDCIIPAAGASSRMGSWKPLLPWGRATLIEAALAPALEAGCRVILVVGKRGGELRELFRGRAGINIVDNPDWERGMLGSIQKALPFVESPAFFSLPADMPFVEAGVYSLLLRAREASASPGSSEAAEAPAGERAYFAAHEGRPGHPVLIPAAWIPEILRLAPGGMLKDFLATRPRRLVEAGSAGVLRDLDEAADYAAALRELPAPGREPPAR